MNNSIVFIFTFLLIAGTVYSEAETKTESSDASSQKLAGLSLRQLSYRINNGQKGSSGSQPSSAKDAAEKAIKRKTQEALSDIQKEFGQRTSAIESSLKLKIDQLRVKFDQLSLTLKQESSNYEKDLNQLISNGVSQLAASASASEGYIVSIVEQSYKDIDERVKISESVFESLVQEIINSVAENFANDKQHLLDFIRQLKAGLQAQIDEAVNKIKGLGKYCKKYKQYPTPIQLILPSPSYEEETETTTYATSTPETTRTTRTTSTRTTREVTFPTRTTTGGTTKPTPTTTTRSTSTRTTTERTTTTRSTTTRTTRTTTTTTTTKKYGYPAYPQPAYPQPAYPQPAYPQPAYPQPAYPSYPPQQESYQNSVYTSFKKRLQGKI